MYAILLSAFVRTPPAVLYCNHSPPIHYYRLTPLHVQCEQIHPHWFHIQQNFRISWKLKTFENENLRFNSSSINCTKFPWLKFVIKLSWLKFYYVRDFKHLKDFEFPVWKHCRGLPVYEYQIRDRTRQTVAVLIQSIRIGVVSMTSAQIALIPVVTWLRWWKYSR